VHDTLRINFVGTTFDGRLCFETRRTGRNPGRWESAVETEPLNRLLNNRRKPAQLTEPHAAERARSGQRAPELSRPEYWSFLCVAALLALAFLRPILSPSGHSTPQPRTGAFGAKRSSDEPPAVQHLRAHDSGRGRHAEAPWQIPLRGWK